MADEFCLKMPDFHVTFRDLLHAVNLRHGINSFNSLPTAGLEHANLGTKGQHATSRPLKPPLILICNFMCSAYAIGFANQGPWNKYTLCYITASCIRTAIHTSQASRPERTAVRARPWLPVRLPARTTRTQI